MAVEFPSERGVDVRTRSGEKKAIVPATSDVVLVSKNVSMVVSYGAVFAEVDMTLLLPA